MQNITCPKCNTAFKIDESGYESIAKQVRNTEFHSELSQRLALAEKGKEDALQLQKSELKGILLEELSKKESEIESENNVKSSDALAISLSDVAIDQKRGLDIIEISALSPSPFEATLIANVYSQQYKNLNLDQNRNQLTLVTNFYIN